MSDGSPRFKTRVRLDDAKDSSNDEEIKKLIFSKELVELPPPQPQLTTNDTDKDGFKVIVKEFDSNMFDKFETRKIEFTSSSQESSWKAKDQDIDKLVQEVHDKIENTATNMLFTWHNLPIVYPPPIADISNIDLNSLFKFPTFDELDEVAVDSNGKRKRLTDQQFDSIKRLGEFEVESKHFEGKKHKWVLARFLQKGYENSNKSFFKDLSNSLHLLIVTAKRRFCSNCFSILDGFKTLGRSFYDFIDLIVGLPQLRVVDYQAKLSLEKNKFLVAELRIDPAQEEQFNQLCSQLNLALEKNIYSREKWSFPHFYRGPDNLVVDLRLYDNELQKNIGPILTELLKIDASEKLFLNNLRDESITLFTNEGLSEADIIDRTTKIVYKEYLKQLNNRLLNSSKLENISPGIGKLLCEHAQAVRLIQQVCDEIANEFHAHMKTYEERLKKEHRVKSLVNDWLNECLTQERERYLRENALLAHQKAIEKCREERLLQATYFLIREMLYYRDHEKDLIEKFMKIKEPTRTYYTNRLIWLPKNYIIEKNESSQPGYQYTLRKSVTYQSDNGKPFWRWENFFIRTFVYFSNIIFLFGIVIPFASPVSFRALFSPNPFYPEKRVNQNTGKLEPNPNSKTRTYWSRLRAIWDHVGVSIDRFESTPDKGLISKNIQRIFNRVWNYIFKGVFGSVALTLIYPLICVISSIGSLILMVLSPIWVPLLNILAHFLFITFFDIDYYPTRFRWFHLFKVVIFDLILRSLCQPIVALFTATIVCPIVSLVLFLFAVSRKSLRKTWDTFMFYAIIKRQAKVPSSDTFLARRVAGPGLSSHYFYQARVEQVLITLEAHLEAKMIRAYFGFVERGLRRPLDTYNRLFNPLFNRYSYYLDTTKGPYMTMVTNVNHYVNLYRNELDKRTEKLDRAINSKNQNIRLVEKDLEPLIIESIKMVKKHYEEILKYQNKNPKEFFEEKEMALNDWEGLAKNELEEVFGVGIITPLEKTDEYFSFSVDHLDLSSYSKMIADSNLRDDLDEVAIHYHPKRSRMTTFQVREDDLALFSPQTEYNQINETQMRSPSRRFGRVGGQRSNTARAENAWRKLTIPTKLPGHLAVTALLVEHVAKTSDGQKDDEIKFSYDKVITAVNTNVTEANKLV